MNLLHLLVRASRGAVALSIVAGVCGGVSGVVLIALINRGITSDRSQAANLAWMYAGLCLVAVLTRVLSQSAMVRLAQGSVSRLALHLCSKIMAVPLERFEHVDPSSLLVVLTEDIMVVTGALIGIPLLCINVPVVLGCLAYIGWLSPPVLLCGLVCAVPAVFGYQELARRAFRQLRLARQAQDSLVAHFRALLGGFRELKLHRRRREAFLQESLRAAAASVRARNVAGMTIYALAAGWSQLAFFGLVGGLVFVLPRYHGLTPQVSHGIVLAILYLMSPLDVIMTWVPILGRARASLLKVQELIPDLESAQLDVAPAGGNEPMAFHESLCLDSVSYTYFRERDGEGFALGPVDFTIQKGETIFLTGGNGSGKTTLVKLLTGLYTADAGAIRLDGRAIPPGSCEAYRALFSAVFADGYLFPTLLGLDPDGLDQRAHALLIQLELDGLVRVNGGAFSSTDLSQGQRRRLALLAACLEDRPICIFDEWAAYQDPHFKRIFYFELLPELKARGKTVIVISHDEEFYGAADRVVRLTGGRVAEDEPHCVAERIP